MIWFTPLIILVLVFVFKQVSQLKYLISWHPLDLEIQYSEKYASTVKIVKVNIFNKWNGVWFCINSGKSKLENEIWLLKMVSGQ